MTKRWNTILRRLTPVLTAGMLLQAGGCTVDTANLFGSLLTSVANALVSDFVFGAFNLV